MVEHKKKSELNQITAPRLKPYVFYGQGVKEPITRPEGARAFVQDVARRGADGIKFFGLRPDLMAAAIDEAKKLGLRTTCHHAQLAVARLNVLDTARMGLTSMQHWYGLPEALFTDKSVQDYPRDYNYNDEQDRFCQAGRLWRQAAPPGSPRWNAVMEELLKLDFTLSPTFHAYETTRDFMRMSRAEWHEEYTHPVALALLPAEPRQPRLVLPLLDHRGRGGLARQLPAVDDVRERVQEPRRPRRRRHRLGLHLQPLRLLLRARDGAAARGGLPPAGGDPLGHPRGRAGAGRRGQRRQPRARQARRHGGRGREPGREPEGALRHRRSEARRKNQLVRVGGVRYTIKDGIVYDAKKLLADVRRMVRETKDKEGFEIRPLGR